MALHALGFDTETYAMVPGCKIPPLVCGSAGWLGDDGTVQGEFLDKEQAMYLFAQLLEDKRKIITGANITFDLSVMALRAAKLGVDIMPQIFDALEEQRVYDLLLAESLHAIAEGHHELDPRTMGPIRNAEGKQGRYSLYACVDMVLGRQDAKANDEWRLRYGELDNIPLELWPQTAKDYPVDDARNTIECALAQTGHLPSLQVAHRMGNNHRCVDGSQDLARTKKMVAVAYGATEPCEVCKGTGKVPSPKAKVIRCRECRGASAAAKMTPSVLAWKAGHPNGCDACKNQGQYLDPTALVICYGGMEEDPENPEKQRKVKTCDGTGFTLPPEVPRSEKEGVGYGRDVLNDSGDEDLIGLAAYQESRKDLEVYCPFFRRARMPVAGHGPDCTHLKSKQKDPCICPGPYKSIPLTLWPNTLVETGRVSYDGIIQLIKRASGYKVMIDGVEHYIPSLRECFEARPGYVYSSTDYEAGELVTLAEVCNKLVGRSDLGDALNAGKKPHNMLGASMIGMLYEEYNKRAKEPMCKDARQAAKAGNFGFPGGAGAATLVLQKRKEAIDTPCENGPHWIEDEDGNKIRGYKGLRFCILMDKAERCGVQKTTRWRDRMIAPTCVRCIECALRLKDFWADQWSEMKLYFDYVQECVEQGMLITEEMLTWWPHLRDWYTPGERLAPGEIMQLVSGRVRGGVTFTKAANSFFQGLLADACKAALRRCARECYDRTLSELEAKRLRGRQEPPLRIAPDCVRPR
jgi:hypothetical protein